MSSLSKSVDLNALKFNQSSIIAINLIGFVFNEPVLSAVVAAILISGSIVPDIAVFKLIYRYAIRPLDIVKQNISEESSAPHNFAQTIGGIFLAIGSFLLYSGNVVTGWLFIWIVILLATVNIVFGFCAGCFVYFQLGKLGVPGFRS